MRRKQKSLLPMLHQKWLIDMSVSLIGMMFNSCLIKDDIGFFGGNQAAVTD